MICPMRKPLLTLLCLLTVAVARAQRATEVYIPIGRSPGVSSKISAIGTCTAVEPREHVEPGECTVTVRADDKTWTTKVTAETKIFLDRSRLGQPNTYGTIDDLRAHRLMEIKYQDGQRVGGGACEWIKVQITTPVEKAGQRPG